MTTVVEVDPASPSPEVLEPAAARLREGGLVAFPTETVYGLGANALDPDAVRSIFAAKGRPPTNPIIVHVASVEQARELARRWPDVAGRLADAFWPGPLTLVLPRADAIDDVVTAGLDTVGLRLPSHPVARLLIELAGVPVAAPSANRYTEVSPTRAEHVVRGLGDAVDIVVDGGSTDVGLESTVVRVEEDGSVTLLRPGMVTAAELEEVVGQPIRRAVDDVDDDTVRPSPGQSVRHYSPRASVVIVDRDEIAGYAADDAMAVVLEGPIRDDWADFGIVVSLSAEPDDWARRLYDLFWEADLSNYAVLAIERPPPQADWEAIHDRLRRAQSIDS